MATLNDLILQQVKNATGNVTIPANVQNQVLSGLTDSILGSLKQTAVKPGGLDQLTSLLTGKTSAASSPVTALAGNLFNSNVISKLGLGALGATLAGLIPKIMGNLSGILKDLDGDGDVDLNDILLALKGNNKSTASAAGLGNLGNIAGGLLGSLLGKK